MAVVSAPATPTTRLKHVSWDCACNSVLEGLFGPRGPGQVPSLGLEVFRRRSRPLEHLGGISLASLALDTAAPPAALFCFRPFQ